MRARPLIDHSVSATGRIVAREFEAPARASLRLSGPHRGCRIAAHGVGRETFQSTLPVVLSYAARSCRCRGPA